MKNRTFGLLGLILAISSTQAQKIEASKVPAAVREAFSKQYKDIPAKWEAEKGNYEAGFKLNGKNMSAIFNPAGSMLESETSIKVSELPASTLDYVKAHYSGVAIREAAKITKADGTVNFEAEVNKKDVIFDKTGKFLREEND
jgi:Putative beta-lactamase-inhibitor-like, PepSY-like